jgi:hypothetical protein
MIFMGLGWQFAFEQWGTVIAGDYALPISFASNYSVVANDDGAAIASIRIKKKTNSIVNFHGRDYTGSDYNKPSVIFIAVGV